MFVLFFGIIFIAELIITIQLVCLIKKADNKVLAINDEFEKCIPFVSSSFINIRVAINKISLSLNKIEQKIAAKKNKYKIIIAKNILSWALLFALNMNAKKVASIVDLIFALKDLAKGLHPKTLL